MSFERLINGPMWKEGALVDGISVANLARKMKWFPVNKLIAYVTGTPDKIPSSIGVLRYSDDWGATFQNAALPGDGLADGCLDVDENATGEIYGLFYNTADPAGDGYRLRAYISTDGMASWTFKRQEPVGEKGFNVAVNKTRPTGTGAIVHLSSTNETTATYRVRVTRDAYVTSAVEQVSSLANGQQADTPLILIVQDLRVVVYAKFASSAKILWQDYASSGSYFGPPNQPTYVTAHTDGDGLLPLDMIHSSDTGPIFVLRDGEGVSGRYIIGRSTDATSWEWFLDPRAEAGSGASPTSFAYDFKADELYVLYSDQAVWALQRATQIDPALVNLAVGEAIDAGEDIDAFGILFEGRQLWVPLPPMDFPPNGYRTLIAQRKGRV